MARCGVDRTPARAPGRPVDAPAWLDDARLAAHADRRSAGAWWCVRRGRAAESLGLVVLDVERLLRDVLPALLAGCIEGGIPLDYDVLITRDEEPAQRGLRVTAGPGGGDFESLGHHGAAVRACTRAILDPAMARGLMPDAAAHRWRFFIKGRGRRARSRGRRGAAAQSRRRCRRADAAGAQRRAAGGDGRSVRSAARDEQLELVARMSHELRTPLATITCAGENLADDARRQRRRDPPVRPHHPAGRASAEQDDRRHPALLPAADPGRCGAQDVRPTRRRRRDRARRGRQP